MPGEALDAHVDSKKEQNLRVYTIIHVHASCRCESILTKVSDW